jgi:hypothetical protein
MSQSSPAATSGSSFPAAAPPAPPGDDPDLRPMIKALALSSATAEAEKAIAGPTEDLWSDDPEKEKARNAVIQAYDKATARNPDGDLRVKYSTAWKKFEAAATDLTRKAQNEPKSRLQRWLDDQLAPGKPLYNLLAERRQLQIRFDARAGERELKQRVAQWQSTHWAANFKDWSDPVASIGSLIGTSADDIDRLNSDIANDVNADYAIYQLWMEVAPRLVQLNPDTDAVGRLPGMADVKQALAFLGNDDRHVQGLQTAAAAERASNGVYLIDATHLLEKQRETLEAWKKKVDEQASAQSEYTLRPDDAASLKARLDAFEQSESEKVKKILSDPTAS